MDYLALQSEVSSLITELGRSIVIKNPTTPTDPTKPWRNAATYTTVATVAGVFVVLSGARFGMEFIPEDLLTRSKEICLVAHTGTDLSQAKIINDGVDYAVDWCYTLKPGTVPLLYAFGVSR